MTWTEAVRKGCARWVWWAAICSAFGGMFLVKGGTSSEFLIAMTVGAAIGVALGFGLGPAAEKGASLLSGVLAGVPFYFLGTCFLVIELQDARTWHRPVHEDGLVVAGIFLSVGCLFSLAQAYRVRKQAKRSTH